MKFHHTTVKFGKQIAGSNTPYNFQPLADTRLHLKLMLNDEQLTSCWKEAYILNKTKQIAIPGSKRTASNLLKQGNLDEKEANQGQSHAHRHGSGPGSMPRSGLASLELQATSFAALVPAGCSNASPFFLFWFIACNRNTAKYREIRRDQKNALQARRNNLENQPFQALASSSRDSRRVSLCLRSIGKWHNIWNPDQL